MKILAARYRFDYSVVKFFKSGNAEAMADAMLQVIKDSALRNALIAKGYDYVACHSSCFFGVSLVFKGSMR
jgi:hypothetical protein